MMNYCYRPTSPFVSVAVESEFSSRRMPFTDRPKSRDQDLAQNEMRKARVFCSRERRFLLTQTGVGPLMLNRLEDAGFASIAELHVQGVEAAIEEISKFIGGGAWANRARALQRAVDAFMACQIGVVAD